MADEPLALRLGDMLSMHNVLTAKTLDDMQDFCEVT